MVIGLVRGAGEVLGGPGHGLTGMGHDDPGGAGIGHRLFREIGRGQSRVDGRQQAAAFKPMAVFQEFVDDAVQMPGFQVLGPKGDAGDLAFRRALNLDRGQMIDQVG